MRDAFRLVCLTTLGTLVACATNSAAPGPNPATSQTAAQNVWSLAFHLSGGFVGFDRELSLTNKGELKVMDRGRAIQVTKQAQPEELSQVASMVVALKPFQPGRGTLCNDCLQYDLSVQTNARTITSSLDDTNLGGTPVEPLVGLLMTILDRELASQPNTPGR